MKMKITWGRGTDLKNKKNFPFLTCSGLNSCPTLHPPPGPTWSASSPIFEAPERLPGSIPIIWVQGWYISCGNLLQMVFTFLTWGLGPHSSSPLTPDLQSSPRKGNWSTWRFGDEVVVFFKSIQNSILLTPILNLYIRLSVLINMKSI